MNTLGWLTALPLIAAIASGLVLLRARRRPRSAVLVAAVGITAVAALLAISSTSSRTATAEAATAPTIQSDLPDYNPGQTVTLTGGGWDVGGGLVHIVVADAQGTVWTHTADVRPDAGGTIVDVFALPKVYVSDYNVTATQDTGHGTLTATSSFTDANPSANLDQCANGTVPADAINGCSSNIADWVNGNLGSSKATYYEGDSIPYRMQFGSLSTSGSHTVTIEWDTTKGGKHAIDYLTTFNRTVTNANPCLGVASCPATPSSFAIPADPQVTGAGVTPIAGAFKLFGGTITGVSAYSPAGTFPTGDNARRITITFTASQANPVLAWGGHISNRTDWGADGSAVAISGSPYHMRLIDLDGSGGNQDRSLSAAAVIYPASITIVKDATPNGPTSFAFTASPAPLANFNLVDDGTTANTKAFTGIVDFTTYAVAETVPAAWTLTGVACTVGGGVSTTPPSTATAALSIVLQEGDNVACTFSNAARPVPQLHLRKVVVNDNGGTATTQDFTLTANGAGANDLSGTSPVDSGSGLLPDTWTLSETAMPGYTASAWVCTGDGTQNGSTITLGYSQSATCTITNDDVAPKLYLRKVVVNDNGGTAAAADFTLTATGGKASNNLTGTTPVDSGAGLKADTWALTESSLPGYAAGSWSCVGGSQSGSSITLGVGGEATCTITNDDIAPKLHLRKLVVNDNGGTALASAFTLTADGTGGNDLSGVTPVDSGATLQADTFALSETTLAGYAPSAWNCVGGSQSGANITVGIGGEATCTITNDDIAPKLHLRKVVANDNGGTATVADFTLTANGTGANDLSGTSPVDSGAGLKADTWALSESSLAGYTASDWNCVGGSQAGASITLGVGGESTCTITNSDAAPKLKLVKNVINDNGGTATAADFTLSAVARTGSDARDFTSATITPTFHTVFGAVVYDLDESGPAGYAAGDWSCDGGTQADASIAVPLGASVTCTIANDDVAPILHLRKVVVNDNGGTATVADFTLSANGAGANDLSGTSPVDSGAGLKADTFALGETGPAGYAASAWDCVGGVQRGSSITLGLGGEATCTITNDDIAPKVHLRKVVVNDNGGTATLADFTLTANGTGANDLSGTSPVDSGAGLKADTWTLSESSMPGYAASGWDCVGGSQDGAEITVGVGGEATCTITNDDVAPQLHLRKVVVNDNGGTATVADFTLTANGAAANDLSGTSPVDSGAGLKADTWTLSETSPAGYAASDWTCVGGSQKGAEITVGIGGEATCTITNDDIAPKLHLRKVVVNDNGGTATVADFTLSATGGVKGNDLSGTSPVDSGKGLLADTWTLAESSLAGYTAGDWSCVGGTQDGAEITVRIGGEATCTITNTDAAPLLKLAKTVVNDNGGTATAADFTLSATAETGSAARDFTSKTNAPTFHAIFGAVVYDLGEAGPAGYAASDWSCTGGTQDGATVVVALGEKATCAITNDDIAPKLHLRKLVVNDNGGTATMADFTLTATGGVKGNDLSGTSPVDGGKALQADTWSLGESGPAGYAASDWICTGGSQDGAEITVGIGGEATCTITNDDVAPKLHLRKVVVNDNGGTATLADFTLTATGGVKGNDLSGVSPVDSDKALQADTWTLSESSLAGYAASAWDCVGGTQDGAEITLGIGGEATCTITNDDVAPQLHLRKVVVNDNGGTATVADFTLTATGGVKGNSLSGTSPVDSGTALQADTWMLSETSLAGYAASDWTCVGGSQKGAEITVGIGGEATCTITNDDIAPILHLRKVVVNDNGGTATLADFTLTATGGVKGNSLSGTSPVDSGAGLQADTWTLSESSMPGYAASDWACVGGSQDGADITVGIGGEATCTITNDDVAPKLHLRKVVVNDNGGTATVADFTLTATGGVQDNDLAGTSPVDSDKALQADTWTLSESSPAGYAASDWTCVGGSQKGAEITVDIGGEATCTITNDDIAPILHLRKVVVNDNGGTATVADFVLTATGGVQGNDLSGTSPVDSASTLQADTWTLSESALVGYAASAWDCVGGSQDGADITVGIGGEATCTVTNDDVAPILRLRKVVVNDNGGTAVPADFTLTATGTEANDVTGPSPVDSGAGLQADTFALTETGPAGYAAGAWDCVGGEQTGSSLVLGIGQEATCTITNNDIAPILRLRKIVVNDNGGTATTADFTLTATGTAGNAVTGTSPVDSGAGLQADTWTLSEVGPAGYTASAWTCVGGTQLGTTIAVAIGGEATCTITNNDNPVIAPPTPVVAPPIAVRGTARILGPEGCILGSTVTTRVIARNVARVVFIRDGRVVRQVPGKGKGLQTFALVTKLSPVDIGVHTVTARVTFAKGATPKAKTLTHRFALCRTIPVTG